MMSGRATWQRVGDWAFKVLIIGLFVYSIGRCAASFKFLPQINLVLPEWAVFLMLATMGIMLLIQISWTLGMLMRRNWARQLWLIGALLGLFEPFVLRWMYGPFSPECSLEKTVGFLAGTGLVVALCVSRPFKCYMHRQGGRIWFWIAVVIHFTLVVGVTVFAIYWQGIVQKKESFQIVELPSSAVNQPLPEGWKMARTFGFSIPIPVGSTNELRTFEDGAEWHLFRSVQGEEASRFALIQKQRALYHSFSALYGIDSLELDYRFLYEHQSLPSVLFRFAGQNFSHVGFQSMNGFNLVFGFWSVNGERDFIQVRLEDTATGDYYEMHLQSTIPLSMEQRFGLISRIQRVTGDSNVQ